MHVVDITTAANYFGRITGITRSEMMIARALAAGETPVRFVFWSNDKARFETYDGPLDYETVCRTRLGLDYSRHVEPVPEIPEALRAPAASSMIVTGSGWLQNTTYTLGALEHAATAGLPVLFYVHDLIPTLFPYYYDDAYVSVFERNLELIARNADVLACNSRNTRDDLLAWCETRAIDPPRTALCYLGDDIGEASDEDAPLPPGLGQRDIVLAGRGGSPAQELRAAGGGLAPACRPDGRALPRPRHRWRRHPRWPDPGPGNRARPGAEGARAHPARHRQRHAGFPVPGRAPGRLSVALRGLGPARGRGPGPGPDLPCLDHPGHRRDRGSRRRCAGPR